MAQILETVSLKQAGKLISVLAAEQSILLLSPPGVGKSELVSQVAAAAGLPLRSLLGTQIAPEDVSGIPKIIGERSVFCPPRLLLPEDAMPFCLFLDELPATAPDVQKAFYSLLLERRIGEYPLPAGTWVVAAGNRLEDRALVRGMSSALCNRVLMLQVRVDVEEWLIWAKQAGIRTDILSFIRIFPDSLNRPVPPGPSPFSTPRAWGLLSRALDLCQQASLLEPANKRALAFGRVSAEDASLFCSFDLPQAELKAPEYYICHPAEIPPDPTLQWCVLQGVRRLVARQEVKEASPVQVNAFLKAIPPEQRFVLLVDLVNEWGQLGAAEAMLASLQEALL